MTSFAFSTVTSVGQSLIAGETGQIAQNGGIVSTGTSVFMAGNSTLQNLGAILSRVSCVSISNGAGVSILQGATGQMISGFDNDAITGAVAGGATLINAGLIQGTRSAINLTGALSATSVVIENSGRIEGGSQPANTISVVLSGTSSSITLGNSGQITGASASATVFLSGTSPIGFANTGTIANLSRTGEAVQILGSATIRNDGAILGSVRAEGPTVTVNTGTVLGSMFLSGTVRNLGEVTGDIVFGSGNDFFDGRRGVVGGTVSLGLGNDTVTTDDGTLLLSDGGGTDLVRSKVSFTIGSSIENLQLIGTDDIDGSGNGFANRLEGNAGNNVLLGGIGSDTLSGGAGNNTLRGGEGDDLIFAGEGNDLLQGGTGNDTLSTDAGNDTILGGSGVDVLFLAMGLPDGEAGVTLSLASGAATLATGDRLKISGIEQVSGTGLSDSLTGNAGDNALVGGNGNDTLAGLAGNDNINGGTGDDSLSGGAGNDVLTGRAGQDVLLGGDGADQFLFFDVLESDPAAPDRIGDFGAGDQIDLGVIDAVPGGGDEAFVFVGTADFAGTGPQLRFFQDAGAGTTTIEVRLSGAGATSMIILLDGLVTLTAESFLL